MALSEKVCVGDVYVDEEGQAVIVGNVAGDGEIMYGAGNSRYWFATPAEFGKKEGYRRIWPVEVPTEKHLTQLVLMLEDGEWVVIQRR